MEMRIDTIVINAVYLFSPDSSKASIPAKMIAGKVTVEPEALPFLNLANLHFLFCLFDGASVKTALEHR